METTLQGEKGADDSLIASGINEIVHAPPDFDSNERHQYGKEVGKLGPMSITGHSKVQNFCKLFDDKYSYLFCAI